MHLCHRTLLSPTITFVFAIASASYASADVVLNMIGTTQWDRSIDTMNSPKVSFTISIDSNTNFPNELNAFNLGLRIVPTIGATGSLATGTVSMASVDSVFDAFQPALFINFPVPDVPTVNGSRQTFADVVISADRTLFDLDFTSPSNDALGTFQIFAVPEFANFFSTTEFDGFKFANVPEGNDVLLGSINVTASAVPEPSAGLMFALATGLCALRYGQRSRLKRR